MTTMTTFKDAYAVLQKNAATLRNQTEPNIDDLLDIVTASVQAYKVCKTRIDAVERALEQALAGGDAAPMADAAAPVAACDDAAPAASPADANGDTDNSDDVPF